MSALAMAAILGFVAMAVDIGLAYQDRRDLQNDADAAALAGTHHLPLNPVTAENAARQWLLKNGIQDAQITDISVESTLVANDTMRVEVDDDFGWVFARAVGLTSSNIGAQARARVGSLEGNNNMMPWAILKEDTDCLDAATGLAIYGADCVVKVGATGIVTGWYGALDYDGGGGGGNEYDENIVDGEVATTYCGEGDFSDPCPGATVVDALSGNKVGGTGSGIEERLAAGPACDDDGNGKDDFNEVFDGDPTGINTYTVMCPNSPRVVVIPIVTTNGAVPVHEVTILGWTLAYLSSYNCSKGTVENVCNGQGHWEVHVTAVNASYSQINGYSGAYDPLNGITIRRLIE
jgi:hypothetical protein